jgi:hypothetical protein
VRYHPKVEFHRDSSQKERRRVNEEGQTILETWGWLGSENDSRRLYVRRIELVRKGQNQWVYTLVELCCWDQHQSELADRSDRSWDNPERRPSHADRRRTIAREMPRKPILAALPRNLSSPYLRTLLEHVITLAA